MTKSMSKYLVVIIVSMLLVQAWQLWQASEQSQISPRSNSAEKSQHVILTPKPFEFSYDKVSKFFGVEPLTELKEASGQSEALKVNFRLVAIDKRHDGYRAVIGASSKATEKTVFVRIGDIIEGFTVQSVSANEVILAGDKIVTLKLFSLPENTLVKGSQE